MKLNLWFDNWLVWHVFSLTSYMEGLTVVTVTSTALFDVLSSWEILSLWNKCAYCTALDVFLVFQMLYSMSYEILKRNLVHSWVIVLDKNCWMFYRYLKEFRTQQCQLFLQHKCTQHRPYTCFHWHFANQRRRRPIRKRDGTFNYTPDSYCSKYDETTGTCPNGEE